MANILMPTFASSTQQALYATTVLADKPVGYWPLNEASGTTAFDRSGNGHNGSYSGTFSLGNVSLRNDLTATCVHTGNTTSVPDMAVSNTSVLQLGTGALSAEVWFKLDTISGGDFGLMGCNGWGVVVIGTGSSTTLRVMLGTTGDANVTPSTNVSISPGIAAGTIYHFVLTSSGTNLHTYLNGVQASSSSFTAGASNSSDGIKLCPPLGGGRNVFGYLQDFAIYNTVLTATSVAAHYAAGT